MAMLTRILPGPGFLAALLLVLLVAILWKIPYLPALAVCAALIGFEKGRPEERVGRAVLFSILTFTWIQYMAVYLITPHDIVWHMSTSVGRLYNQLIPALLLLIFLLVRRLSPERPARA